MTREQIYEELRNSLCKLFEFPEEKVTLETNLIDDLDLDSIDIFDLLSKLEETVGIELLPEDFKDCRTVSQVVDKLTELLAEEDTSGVAETRALS